MGAWYDHSPSLLRSTLAALSAAALFDPRTSMNDDDAIGECATGLPPSGRLRAVRILVAQVLVSHDFRLISQVAEEIWEVNKGVHKFDGDILAFKEHLRRTHAALRDQ